MKVMRYAALACTGLFLALLHIGCGVPPMYWAIYHNEITKVDSLITAGQDVNARWLKSSPLHQAAAKDRVQIAQLLLQRGADPFILDMNKRTPLQVAEKENFPQMAQLLRAAEEEKNKYFNSTAGSMAASDPGKSQVIPMAQRLTLSVMDLNVTSGLSSQEVMMLTDKLLNEFVNDGFYKVVERSKRDEILREQGFQQSGACDQGACLVEAGQLLGVQKMVGGTIGKLGSLYAVELRVMDVKTGEIDKAFSRQYSGDVSALLGAMKEAAAVFSGMPGSAMETKGRRQ